MTRIGPKRAPSWPSHEGRKPDDFEAEVLLLRGLNRGLEVKLDLLNQQLNAMPPWQSIPPTAREAQLQRRVAALESDMRGMTARGIERERHVQWLEDVVRGAVERQDTDNAGCE